jgi:hypothetical protein
MYAPTSLTPGDCRVQAVHHFIAIYNHTSDAADSSGCHCLLPAPEAHRR